MAQKKGKPNPKLILPAKLALRNAVGSSFAKRITDADYQRYMDLYAKGTTQMQCAELVGISPQSVWLKRKAEPIWEEKWQLADDGFTNALEVKAHDMAMNCPVTSPTMIIFALNARRPEKYRPQVGVKHSGTVTFANEFAAAMSAVYDTAQPPAKH